VKPPISNGLEIEGARDFNQLQGTANTVSWPPSEV
jgi:hypothetical protein